MAWLLILVLQSEGVSSEVIGHYSPITSTSRSRNTTRLVEQARCEADAAALREALTPRFGRGVNTYCIWGRWRIYR